jgi:two-component system nitrate/nitrite response regulator NarL
MEQLFVTRDGRARRRWLEAFEACRAAPGVPEALALSRFDRPLLWLDATGLDALERDARLSEAVASGSRVVVMSPTPTESEAFHSLGLGAMGYCHVEAAPEQLREISVVVQHGGLWMLPDLIRRMTRLSLRVVPPRTAPTPELDVLTARELMVAQQVARGASNQEIAIALDISERTVKAHLSSAFDKLGVRDRVQLALLMNDIPTVTSVN